MASYKEQIERIRKLRKEREQSDERLYRSKLELNKVESYYRRMLRKETVPSDKKKMDDMRADMAHPEAQLRELTQQINEADSVLEKIRENKNRIQYLSKRVVAIDAQLREAEEMMRKNNTAVNPDKKLIQEQVKKAAELRGLLNGLKHDLAKSKLLNRELSQDQQEATKRKEIIGAKIKQYHEMLAEQENKLSHAAETIIPLGEGLERKKIRIEEAYRSSKKELSDIHDNLQKAIEGLYGERHPCEILKELYDGIPFLLFPIRIETRFVPIGERTELWLRIYPDDIAVHTHETLLTVEEVTEGERYWKELFHAEKSDDHKKEDRKKSAWIHIALIFGPQRSAWIARETMPTNWTSGLEEVESEDQLIFPVHDTTKTAAWSRAPRTKILPDKFVVMLYEGDTIMQEEIGKLVPDELYLGPDPLEPEDSFQKKDDKLLFGETFDWTSDFNKAVQVGMGFKIKLTPAQAKVGVDKILVLGVYLSADETDSKLALEELIDNHHYSPKGFSLVLQGTPTNNTELDGSGYTKNDQFNNVSYFVETGTPKFTETTDCDGRNLADALGIEIEYPDQYGPLQYVLNSDGTDYQDAVMMNKALYQATLGYYFETLLMPVLDETTLDTLREFFVKHVTGRGPLPAIRVGNQPYGILLTSDFGKWWEKRDATHYSVFLKKLHSVLFHYQRIWDGLLGEIKYVGKSGEDPSDVLMNVLGLQAGSASFYQRIGYSTDYLKNLDDFQFGGKYWPELSQHFGQKINLLGFLSQFGYNTKDDTGHLVVPQALRLVYQHYNTMLDSANLVDNVPLSEKVHIRYYDESNHKNYLDWLAETSSIEALEQQMFGEGKKPPNALMYMMLRRALLLQLHKASVSWFKKHDIDLEYTMRAGNFYNIRPQGDLTKFEVMKAKVGVAVPDHPQDMVAISEYLLTNGRNEDEAQYLNEIRTSLKTLAGAGTAKLERCFTEHIDVCTYRLDAWQTALFRLRLLKQRNVLSSDNRKRRNKGIFIGAYGWLENIRPINKRPISYENVPEKLRPISIPDQVDASIFESNILERIPNESDRKILESCYSRGNDSKTYILRKDLPDQDRTQLMRVLRSAQYFQPLFEDSSKGGFVHSPSLDQAAAAAILRSAYLSHASSDNPDIMAVNLSSERVRRALFILQGIRNGQMLEALLGYQFERGMHDKASANDRLKNLNLFIYDFREAFPIREHKIKQQGQELSDGPIESLPAHNVVNGVALAECTSDFPFGVSGGVVAANSEEKSAIENEKDRLADTLDAVKDLLLAESAYQMVQGNSDRASAVLNALKEASIPPEMDVIKTPRSSHINFTNRVTLQFESTYLGHEGCNPWSTISMTPRAIIEAGLNKWLGKVLGKPEDIYYRVVCLNPDGSEIDGTSTEMSVKDLELQPIDMVYITGNELNTGANEQGKEAKTAASELESRIAHAYRQRTGQDDKAVIRIEFMRPEGKKRLGQMLPLLRMLKSMITDARHLNAQDFDSPSKNSLAGVSNPKGYEVNDLKVRIENCISSFESILQELSSITLDVVVKDKAGASHICANFQDAFAIITEAQISFADIGFIDFSGRDFKDNYSIPLLCDRLRKDGFVIDETIEGLNALLHTVDLYEKVINKNMDQSPTEELRRFKTTYDATHGQNDLRWLNRATLEEFYGQTTPKGQYENGVIHEFDAIPELHDVLMRLSKFGISDVFPGLITAVSVEDKIIMLGQARRAFRKAIEILAIAQDLKGKADATRDIQNRIDSYVAAGKVLLGDVFNIIPLFTYSNEADIQLSNSDRGQLLKYAKATLKMEIPEDEWLQNVSHVRPRIARWDYFRTLAESLNNITLELKPIQLPYCTDDSWLAVEIPTHREKSNEPFTIIHDTISITVHGDSAFTPGTKQSGLLIDDWTEVIPTKEEITGITFNYNQPNACPPQALLLAVTPQEKGFWTWEDLIGILNDTLQRSKRRAVEPILLDKVDPHEVGLLLPMLVADFSQYDLNVSLDYRLNLKSMFNTFSVLPVDPDTGPIT